MKFLKLLARAASIMVLLGLTVAALQGTSNSDKALHPQVQQSPNPASIPTGTTQAADNPSDSKGPQVKEEPQSKRPLDLGSMPCPPNDQTCRTKEKERLAAAPPQEHL